MYLAGIRAFTGVSFSLVILSFTSKGSTRVGICDAKHPAPSDRPGRTVRPPRNNVPDDLAEATQQLGSSIVILVKLI